MTTFEKDEVASEKAVPIIVTVKSFFANSISASLKPLAKIDEKLSKTNPPTINTTTAIIE